VSYRRRVRDILPLLLTAAESEAVLNIMRRAPEPMSWERWAVARAAEKLLAHPGWRATNHPGSKAEEMRRRRLAKAANRRAAKRKNP